MLVCDHGGLISKLKRGELDPSRGLQNGSTKLCCAQHAVTKSTVHLEHIIPAGNANQIQRRSWQKLNPVFEMSVEKKTRAKANCVMAISAELSACKRFYFNVIMKNCVEIVFSVVR